MIFKRVFKKIKGFFEVSKKPRGRFVLKDANGKILIDRANLVVDGSRWILQRLVGSAQSNKELQNLRVGTGTSPASLTDSSLGNQVDIATSGIEPWNKLKTSTTYPTSESVTFHFTLTTGEANGNLLTEFGLYDDNDTMFSRVVTAGYAKDATTTLTIEWTITFE